MTTKYKRLPARPDIGHLKKQAKALLALYRSGDPAAAISRFREGLPVAAGKSDAAIAGLGLRLHDAQSCIAREYGFSSWNDLQGFVAVRNAHSVDPAQAMLGWMRLLYAGDIAGGADRAKPSVALRLLEENAALSGNGDPYIACAIGDEAALRRAMAQDPGLVHRTGGPLLLPPLVAVTHSSLLRLADFRDRLHACAKLLLDAGADPSQAVGSRRPPASLAAPSNESPLSALYGAAGQNHDPVLARLLLDAGADPNDGESLYHSLEHPACTRLLLEAGARITGTNALYRVLDLDDVGTLRLLLAHGGDANEPAPGEPTAEWGSPLLWAIRRRRSPAHIQALLAAGADVSARARDGSSAYVIALRFGLTQVAQWLREAGGATSLPEEEQFVAACAQGDEATARRMLAQRPHLFDALSAAQLRQLPELAAEGAGDAVRLMVELGWPIATRGGDIDGSALNHAVFRGDPGLTRFMLEHGARWTERHGFDDNACGSLSWASINEPVAGGDWVGCAEALVAHGMPAARPDPQSPDSVLVDGVRRWFSDEVTDFLLGASAAPAGI